MSQRPGESRADFRGRDPVAYRMSETGLGSGGFRSAVSYPTVSIPSSAWSARSASAPSRVQASTRSSTRGTSVAWEAVKLVGWFGLGLLIAAATSGSADAAKPGRPKQK